MRTQDKEGFNATYNFEEPPITANGKQSFISHDVPYMPPDNPNGTFEIPSAQNKSSVANLSTICAENIDNSSYSEDVSNTRKLTYAVPPESSYVTATNASVSSEHARNANINNLTYDNCDISNPPVVYNQHGGYPNDSTNHNLQKLSRDSSQGILDIFILHV